MRDEIRDILIDKGVLPPRPMPEHRETPEQAELKALDAKRKERADVRGRLNLQELEDEKRRAFLLARMARTNPQPESQKVMARWRDEMTTPAHQFDESPMKGANRG